MDIQEAPTSAHLQIQPACAVTNFQSVCRLCASHNDKCISIYSEEGISNDMSNKINLYLPIKVSENDELPLQCCWNCASTLLAWHELVICSIESDRRLRNFQFTVDKPLDRNIPFEPTGDIPTQEEQGNGPDPLNISLNVFCQTETTQDISLSTDNNKKTAKCAKRKKKPDLINYYPPPEVSGSLETYISDLDQQFSANAELTENPDLKDLKVTIDEDHFEDSDDNKDIKDLDLDNLEDSNSDDEAIVTSECGKSDWENINSYFACQYCNAIFLSREDVVNHMQEDHPGQEHLEPKAEPIPEEQRLGKDRRKSNKIDQAVINAAKVIVDGRIYYNCTDCGKSLHSPYTYVWHMRIHTGERPFVCDLCGKQFRVSQGLVRHLRETHQGIKKFPCDICGRMFATRRNVEEHRRIHTNERPYICDLCGKSFKQKASLFVHKRSHKDYFPFTCSYCNQGFRTKPPLLIHVTRHTGEKPYRCEICGRCFRIKYELKRHRLIHSDEKPFCCTLCGSSFRQKRYLRNHTKSNHSTSP